MVAVVILLLALLLASGGVLAIITGCRDEYRSRRLPSADEIQLMAEIEEWMTHQR